MLPVSVQRYLCKYAWSIPFLDVSAGSVSRCCDDHFRDRSTVQSYQKLLCKGGEVVWIVNSMAILILLGSFFLMIMLRFPIAYAVALSSVFCLMAQGLPLTTICQQMVKGISSFSLMAVPFFITMGCLMGSGGISEKLIALANAA